MWRIRCLDQNDWKITIVRVTQTSYANPNIQTHLIWQKDSARRCRECILGLNEDEVAQGVMGPRMVSPSRVISAASCELVVCEVSNDGTKAVAVDRMRTRGAATRRRDVILELRL